MNTDQPMSFNSVLVANRGEIALRVFRSAKKRGLRTIAVYSSADENARHVRAADQAIHIGDAPARKSYLNIAAIIEAARQSGADAIHPGYGFLSENSDFAQACADAGLLFIGPSALAIRSMGDKATAKRFAEQAGIECIPGYFGDDQTDEKLTVEADRIGYPLMIKALSGGGGRGIRLVEQVSDFLKSLNSARAEAKAAFGDARVMLERAIRSPRHVEIQVFGDRHGNAVHFGDRDCSVQRRHQKLVEEAPSPGVSEDLRQRLGGAAISLVKAIGYEGAGTVEFLLDEGGRFYFMEMNTRLQVEHPVTEEVTGVDLVDLQFQVVGGEALRVRQDDIRLVGHSIEVRLCAEDPLRNFMPQAGTISSWRAPVGVRVEDAIESGSVVSPHYDSLIAKIVAHGDTREEARTRLIDALKATVVKGIKTNREFLASVLAHPQFADGGVSTKFLSDHGAAILQSVNLFSATSEDNKV